MSADPAPGTRFIADRMLGTLTRYLRFMGYDTTSANRLEPGNRKEDTVLLDMAVKEKRILLTRDAELSRRGKDLAVFVRSEEVMEQVQQLVDLGLVEPRMVLCRCSLCNTLLRDATVEEIGRSDYAPRDREGLSFTWCEHCGKLYWNGSHGVHISGMIGGIQKGR
ncbi:Mut7-C RNAse domain-containing protein [uncultured Methanoregula sp.]|uniref:Mut7-C RNAse domain-containing protein n=1 Tax=uncultured Methanoregula sp. TaxID=1005933 RepID=UPI002AAB423C|nr:Mut7-C RNAse domain-containing protein [uncultured Methanoregula sp.]